MLFHWATGLGIRRSKSMLMRSLAALSVLVGAFGVGALAYDDNCSRAERRFSVMCHTYNDQENAFFQQYMRRPMSGSTTAYRTRKDCPALTALSQARLTEAQALQAAVREVETACGPKRKQLPPVNDTKDYQSNIDACRTIMGKAWSETVGYSGIKQQTSCSDITGTGDPSPARVHCDVAKRRLADARADRQKYPTLVRDEYKRASEAYHYAGDHRRAELVLREMEAPDPTRFITEEAQIDAQKRQLADAEDEARRAGYVEDQALKDGNCSDLQDAIDRYNAATRKFIDASSYDRATEIAQRTDSLEKTLKQARAEGRCDRKLAQPRSSPPGQKPNNDDKCQKAIELVKSVLSSGGNPDPLDKSFAKMGCSLRAIVLGIRRKCVNIPLNVDLSSTEKANLLKKEGCPLNYDTLNDEQ